jgi:hypothetical protein
MCLSLKTIPVPVKVGMALHKLEEYVGKPKRLKRRPAISSHVLLWLRSITSVNNSHLREYHDILLHEDCAQASTATLGSPTCWTV